ncbi:MAG: hypothetical protein FJY80_07885 [Candidatus Aminicenantes bacterium]|nr:hypothetical protein [Candidatus Aminicenantes bacterium]
MDIRSKNTFLPAVLAVLALACRTAGTLETPRPEDPSGWDARRIEAYLKKARVVEIRKDLEPGRTLPWRVFLDDGTTKARARFKYMNRPRPLPLADSYRYDLAGYALSRLLDLDIVPPTIEREILGTSGALQWYLEGCLSERDRMRVNLQPPDPDAFRRRMDEIKVFELLANDRCQDVDDTLIHKDDWRVCRVDFSEAFAPSSALAEDCPVERCSRRFYDRLETTSRSLLVARLKSYLNEAELDALWRRWMQLLSRLHALIREKGEREVIY